MKKNLLFLSVILSMSLFISSCGGNDDHSTPTIEGTWSINERTITSNYSDYDGLMNQYFRADAARYDLKRVFTSTRVRTTATLPESEVPVRVTEGNYQIVGDTLYIEDQTLFRTVKSRFLLGNTILVTYRKVDKTDLIAIFSEIGLFDPNILPDDIKGELKMRELR